MFFPVLKAYARLAIRIYCRKIVVDKPGWLRAQGPLLLACNHPNSFLDGVILTTLFDAKVYSLVRGDVFRKPWHNRLLRSLNLLPVYRTSEGSENLEHNYTTFDACRGIFRKGGIVIIFSEGRCINEWHLRPLRKGTARLATAAWQEGIDLTVLPAGLNYNSFRNFGKNVFIHFGEPLDRQAVLDHVGDGCMYASFNEQLRTQLKHLVYEIPAGNELLLRKRVFVPQSLARKVLLAMPALTGLLLHAPIYFIAKAINSRAFDNDHFDSTLVGMLALSYPVYLLLLSGLAAWTWSWLAAAAVWVVLPVSAWACVQLKEQLSG